MKYLLVIIAFFLSGCVAQPKPIDWSNYNAANPTSILVVPIVNNSLDVDAANYALSTLSVPLAEQGYYVFPVNTVKVILEQEGLYEPEQVHKENSASLANMFGADAILYVTIQRWDAQYVVLATTVSVQFEYRMVDKNGNEIWAAEKTMTYSPSSNSSGNPLVDLIVMAVNAAVVKAAPNYMPLTRQANQQVLVLENTALPKGPYARGKNKKDTQ